MASPSRSQNSLSSGVQRVSTRPARAPLREGEEEEEEEGVAGMSRSPCIRHSTVRRAAAGVHHIGAAHLGEIHPGQRHPDHAVHQHEGAGTHACPVQQHTEQDGQHEAAQAAGQAHDAADGADVGGVVVADVLEDARLAEGHGDAQHEHEPGERVHVQTDVEAARAVGGEHREIGLRVRQQEQAHPADPQHPPGHAVGAVFVAQHTADGAQHAAGQREAGGQQGGDADVQPVFAHVVLHHPERQRHIAAEHDAVVLAVLEHARVLQRLQLVHEGDVAGHAVRRIAVAEQPEQHQRAEHDGRIGVRHGRPAEGHQDGRRHELVHRRAGIARAVDAHGRPLALLRKPARHVGRAHRERASGQPDEQADREEVPVLGGIAHDPDGRHRRRHQAGHHDAAAVAVRPDAQRHAHERAREHRHGREQAELRGVQAQHLLDRDADDAEHHPHHEAHGKGKRAHGEHGPGLAGAVRGSVRGCGRGVSHLVFLVGAMAWMIALAERAAYPPEVRPRQGRRTRRGPAL